MRREAAGVQPFRLLKRHFSAKPARGIERNPISDAVEPVSKQGAVLEGRELEVSLDESLLRGVARILKIPQPVERDREDGVPVAPHKLAEGRLVSSQRRCRKLAVRLPTRHGSTPYDIVESWL
jgi:hypothetical protein